MAKLSGTSVEKSLKAFSASLEDLTFNSKPIIDELTRFAGSYNQLAPQVVQRVEDHILEVEWTLYVAIILLFCCATIVYPFMFISKPCLLFVLARVWEKCTGVICYSCIKIKILEKWCNSLSVLMKAKNSTNLFLCFDRQVRPDWKLPSLYLLDSILKNVKGEYLPLFSKNIVHIFCHCFEKLVCQT